MSREKIEGWDVTRENRGDETNLVLTRDEGEYVVMRCEAGMPEDLMKAQAAVLITKRAVDLNQLRGTKSSKIVTRLKALQGDFVALQQKYARDAILASSELDEED